MIPSYLSHPRPLYDPSTKYGVEFKIINAFGKGEKDNNAEECTAI
jgi:hypothetical protein